MAKKYASIIEFMEQFPDENSCRKHFAQIRWGDDPKCPHCFSEEIYEYKNGITYKCKPCSRQFRVTTGTIFEGSNLSLRTWFIAYHTFQTHKKGVSSVQLGAMLGVTQKTAWHVSHKIRIAMRNTSQRRKLRGICEVDETYYGGKRKGKRGRGALGKTPIFGILERDGTLRIYPVENTKRKTLEPLILQNVKKGTRIMSDEWGAYNHLNKVYIHKIVNHGVKEYVRGNIHVNGLEGVWSLLKRSLKGIYHRPSKKYLDNYCGEFEFRYNTRKKSIEMRFNQALKQSRVRIKNKELTENYQ